MVGSRLERARALGAEGRWEPAAALFEAEAREARDRGLARRAWAGAGDALRRDDRPARAARCLRAALDLSDRGDAGRGVLRASLASVLIDAGEPIPAEILLREAMPEATDAPGRLILLDLLLGALVVLGRVDEADGPLEELASVVAALPRDIGPLAAATLDFRRAVQHRLRGEAAQAERRLGAALAAMEGQRATVGAAAAAASERAELALLAGNGAEAAARFDHAARLWTAAGRRAGLYRCEAGLVRAALADGQTPLASGLERPIQYSRERGLPLLEAELRIARGAARAAAHVRGAEEDMDHAVRLAERASALLLEGRARLYRRRCGFLRNDLERTRLCLAGDAVWRAEADKPQVGEQRGGVW